MNIDHICIAVRSIEKASKHFCGLFGYEEYTETVINTRQQVKVKFLRKPGSLEIKLISPVDKNSPLINFLRKGEGLHHICFKVDSIKESFEDLCDRKLRVLSPPEPGEAFDNELIAFMYAGHGLNIELIDTDKRADLKVE